MSQEIRQYLKGQGLQGDYLTRSAQLIAFRIQGTLAKNKAHRVGSLAYNETIIQR
jgi:hypothetical protein